MSKADKDTLAGRIALVTGGSCGIGLAIAKHLANEGALVVLAARRRAKLQQAASDIQSAGGRADIVCVDGTKMAQVKKAIARLEKSHGKIDILVNNAGGASKFGDLDDLELSDWLEAFNRNVMTAVHFTRCALPLLRRSQNPRVVFISSIAAVQPGRYNPHYTTTKAAVLNFGKYLANKLAPEGILVNVVCPGPVHSDSWKQNIKRYAAEKNISLEKAGKKIEQEEAAKIPLGRVGDGEDIAPLVGWLVSDGAAWVTGSVFHVNGGKLAGVV